MDKSLHLLGYSLGKPAVNFPFALCSNNNYKDTLAIGGFHYIWNNYRLCI